MNILFIIGTIIFGVFIIAILIIFLILMKIINNLSDRLLQVEVVKKAKDIGEAKQAAEINIKARQKVDKRIIDKQEKSFLEAAEKAPTPEEKAEAEWIDGVK